MVDHPPLSGRARLAQSVIIGEDDILFHRDHEAVEQISGALPFTPEDLAHWVRIVEARARWCDANKVVFRFLIVPEKHVVYADKLPGIAVSSNRPALQLLAGLSASTRARCLYPADALIEARQRFPTYYQNDTHWTQRGAFVAYGLLMASLRGEIAFSPVTEDLLDPRESQYTGDLGVRLEPERQETAIALWHKEFWPWRRVFENHGRARGSTIVFESDRKQAPRILVFRDSFFNYLLPHVIPVFARTVVVGSIDMHPDLVAAVKPDIMLFEVAERFLGQLNASGGRDLPQDREDLAFETFSGVSLDKIAG